MKIIVINLERAGERRAQMEKSLAGDPRVEFLRATDCNDLKSGADTSPFGLCEDWLMQYAMLSWGEVACALSHIRAWKTIQASGAPHGLVLEDDILLHDDWNDKLARTVAELDKLDWDLCYLWRNPQHDTPEDDVSAHLVRAKCSYGGQAYLLSQRGIDKLLSYELEARIIPVDVFLPGTYDKHPAPCVGDQFGHGPRLNAFAAKEFFCDNPDDHSYTQSQNWVRSPCDIPLPLVTSPTLQCQWRRGQLEIYPNASNPFASPALRDEPLRLDEESIAAIHDTLMDFAQPKTFAQYANELELDSAAKAEHHEFVGHVFRLGVLRRATGTFPPSNSGQVAAETLLKYI